MANMCDLQFTEAVERLALLEKLFRTNPNIKKYFEEGRLYYSYITGGGYIGSIDTINYDQRYAGIIKAFESETSFLVYHVIEHGDTLALLFVSNDEDSWLNERPTIAGVMAQVINVNTRDSELGYIKVDQLQGALYRIDNKVYSSLPGMNEQVAEIYDTDSEIIERLEILKSAGLMTDLDISEIYAKGREICFSMPQVILGTLIGLVNRISTNNACTMLYEQLSELLSLKIYFLIGSTSHKLAFLFVSDDSTVWEEEKSELKRKKPSAIVVDTKEMSAEIQQIRYEMVNGGPLYICD